MGIGISNHEKPAEAQVPAQSLELGSVARRDGDIGVYVEAAALADALGLARASRVHETKQGLARSVAGEAVTRGGHAAERRERELLSERLRSVALAGAVDCAAVAR